MSLAPDQLNTSIAREDLLESSLRTTGGNRSIHNSVHTSYSLAAAAWLAALAAPLLFFPRILSLIFPSPLLEDLGINNVVEGAVGSGSAIPTIRQLTLLELSLSKLGGFALAAFAVLLLLQSSAIPIALSSTSASASPAAQRADSPHRVPTILITIFLMTSLAFSSYGIEMYSVALPSAGIAVWGALAVIFGNDSVVNSSGGKAQVSSYPFKNDHAEAVKDQVRGEKKAL